MALDIPLPTASAYDDPLQYVPLLLSAIEGFLESRDVWEPTDYDDALAYMEDLKGYIVQLINEGAMSNAIGRIAMHGSATPPDGWLLCDGSAVSRTTYVKLFDVIGTTWGVGDGSTTFNLPDMTEASPMGTGGDVVTDIGDFDGALSVSLTLAQMPAHDHDFVQVAHSHSVTDHGHVHTKTTRGSGTAGGTTNVMSAPTQTTLSSNWQTDSAQAGVTIDNASAGITFHSQGSNLDHNNLHPVIGLPFIIFAGV